MSIPRRYLLPLGLGFLFFFVLPLLVPATLKLLQPSASRIVRTTRGVIGSAPYRPLPARRPGSPSP